MEQWITDVVGNFGYVGIFLLMLGENLFPPIPSEVIMPIAGLAVGGGQLSFVPTVIAALAGSLIGNLPWFYVARKLGRRRIIDLVDRRGRMLAMRPKDVEDAIGWFDRHGDLAVLIGRLAPGVRTLISVPAGLSEMSLIHFLVLSAIGSVVWIALLLGAGILLQQNWTLVSDVLGPAGLVILATIGLGLIFWIVRRRRQERAGAENPRKD